MRYFVLACDYDGTLASDGCVGEDTLAALTRLRETGRKLILVTGRELQDLLTVFSHLELFDCVVAENGAVLYQPSTRQETLLGAAPPDHFVRVLRERGVQSLSTGRVIVATWQPYEATVLEAIGELGLELQVVFNKGAVMVLPAGITKATGLAAALEELALSPHNVAGVGDAENDHALLSQCECSAAVANAIPALKERADLVTHGDHGTGVVELIDELIATDLRGQDERLTRHHLLLGTGDDGAAVRLPPFGMNLLIAGPSGSGKSTAATAFLERLVEHKYQFCVIDPEGDYTTFEGAVSLGNSQRPPSVEEILQLLHRPDANVAVNLVGLPLLDRPAFFTALLPHMQELRARTGRPHWCIVDEAHHLLPTSWVPGALALPQALECTAFITVHPNQVASSVLASVDTVIAVGQDPETTLAQFCDGLKTCARPAACPSAQPGEVVLWRRHCGEVPFRVHLTPGRTEHRRHVRKYAEGQLPPDRSFYFEGPEGKLHLRAHNLLLFMQLAEGVDDATWLHHLRQGDYSRWFREAIKDEVLAAEGAQIENRTDITSAESRVLLKGAIERHYTLPASTSLGLPGSG